MWRVMGGRGAPAAESAFTKGSARARGGPAARGARALRCGGGCIREIKGGLVLPVRAVKANQRAKHLLVSGEPAQGLPRPFQPHAVKTDRLFEDVAQKAGRDRMQGGQVIGLAMM